MNKIFTEDIPVIKTGTNKGRFDWNGIVGSEIRLEYNGKIEKIKIIKEISKCGNTRKYEVFVGGEIKTITSTTLAKGSIGNLKPKIKKYKYKVEDIVENKKGKFRIVAFCKKEKVKTYEVECLDCGGITRKTENNLQKEVGCGICSNKIVVTGINDLWTTNPEIAEQLWNTEEGFETTSGNCSQKKRWKCKNCSAECNVATVYNVKKYGTSCPKCGDGISFAEKFVWGVLDQLGVHFERQKVFETDRSRSFDFYFEKDEKKYAIEVQGDQHSAKGFESCGGRTLEEEQTNDRYKKEILNRENVELIEIEAGERARENLKEVVANSLIGSLFDLKKIEWSEIIKTASSSLVVKTWEMIKKYPNKSSGEIAKEMKISKRSFRDYAKRGANLGVCNYTIEKGKENGERRKIEVARKKFSKAVVCIELDMTYASMTEAEKELGIDTGGISACCRGVSLSAGVDKKGNRLRWMFLEDYNKLTPEEKIKIRNKKLGRKHKKVICLNDNRVFDNAQRATEYYKLGKDKVSRSCRLKKPTVCGLDFRIIS